MKNKVALQKTVQGWKFIDEAELETFVWDNLAEIFELKPFARQLNIKGEICDIIGISKNNQLTIIDRTYAITLCNPLSFSQGETLTR